MVTRKVCQFLQRRCASAAAAVRPPPAEMLSQRNAVFSREQARQRALYPRIEKIEVSMHGPGLDGTLLIMNKGMSTPLSCARHLTEYHVNNSVLALVDGELWPLHRPLTHSCSLSLLTFKDNDPTVVNEAYWRSCAALLGQVLETAFKDKFNVDLLSTVEVPVTSGAFCCDVVLDPQLDSWTPSEESLRSLTKGAQQLILKDLAWEPLEVVPSVALEVFSHHRCKQEEIEQKAAENPKGTVMLYRCGDHVLLSGGPLVARTGLCLQYEVTALHSLGQGPWGLHRRAQGLSLPLQLQAHHTVWRKLRQRAEKLVEVSRPEAAPASPPDSTSSQPATAL
ncbi:large ribosomal subunit protein mL39 [Takifugu rubripes]|uniref:Large ribosomal subunit protein mL39 n=1 Tax=Takifugu rubripes TaxID=31033 RepID=H2TMQ4_TAKRU|nr:39S ribosomal protein L39, mitochondrial [Takifugu rubripes]|eukprot:XP_011604408.1 PREDICTED: 39S ribosomal protein L39, mitochondrial [Takifugu rubripes]